MYADRSSVKTSLQVHISFYNQNFPELKHKLILFTVNLQVLSFEIQLFWHHPDSHGNIN